MSMGRNRSSLRVLAASVLVLMAYAVLPAMAETEEALPLPEGRVLLEVRGEIARMNGEGRALFDRAMLERLPAATLETTTVVTDGVKRFDGFYMRDLLDLVGARAETITARALNDYAIDIPAEDFEEFDVVVATHMDDERLEPHDKGPLWIVYPRDDHSVLQDLRYDYRWVWQLNRLDIR